MKKILLLLIVIVSCKENVKEFGFNENNATKSIKLSSQDSLRIVEFWSKANQVGLYSTMRQQYLDSILSIKPDSAYFWQQKAMPLYKARKYSLGKPFLEKAVEYAPEEFLSYSGFMKCIFSKEYNESIEELLLVKEKYGDSYVMDHTYNFYIALSYLQLNKFAKAKEYLIKSREQQFIDFPKDPPHEACHFLDWYYLGIAEYELGHYEDAIAYFDMALRVYENFGDAMYFKASALKKIDRKDEAWELIEKAFKNADNTINEDQVFYEVYPYQIFHRLSPMSRPK
ncbi:tetratricopeptide repeat protein [Maribacter sp. HTCC2170]|uniref:tetratricopeptide repeat protein n=1 Tax=Maribacter sp. (strain HTCC2170 / KCCM 42371) TaxID=313603 RepID=UPI00006AE60E|nr:tetratricopeptide repeat protein [Maribacter sp. HTCC2170]EAR00600.1 O-linked GlnNAc transferase [Maribacter sp. HTCC2170]